MGAMIAVAVPPARRRPAPGLHAVPPPAPVSAEEALVAAARAGSREALGTLLRSYESRLFRLAYGIVGSRDRALDVVQQAMLRVCTGLSQFTGASSFSTWVWRITRNAALDEVRRPRQDAPTAEGEIEAGDEECLATRPLSVHESADRALARRRLGGALETALATLSENHRTILLLREIDGLTYEEIAAILRIPEGTVMSRLFHARRRMQAALAALGVDREA